jgi:hypothetical protein
MRLANLSNLSILVLILSFFILISVGLAKNFLVSSFGLCLLVDGCFVRAFILIIGLRLNVLSLSLPALGGCLLLGRRSGTRLGNSLLRRGLRNGWLVEARSLRSLARTGGCLLGGAFVGGTEREVEFLLYGEDLVLGGSVVLESKLIGNLDVINLLSVSNIENEKLC